MPDSKPMSEDMQALLANERLRQAPAAATQDRLWSRLEGTLGGLPTGGGPSGGSSGGSGGGPSGGAATPASGALGSLAHKPLLLALATFGLGVLAGVAGTLGLSRDTPTVSEPPEPPSVTLPLESKVETVAPPVDARPQVQATAGAGVNPPKKARARPPDRGSTARGLARERSLIEVARSALTRTNMPLAFAQLKTHEREFSDGALAQEREALWVEALVRADRNDEARQRGQRFRKRFPESMLLPVVEHALQRAKEKQEREEP